MAIPGQQAPDFTATTTRGVSFTLSAHYGKVVVLFFFPAAYSPLCSRQVVDFARSWRDFEELGAEVIGISSDDHQTQCQFAADNNLPYALIADTGSKISELYGARWPIISRSRRITFVIDPMGVIRNVFKHELRSGLHAPEAQDAARQIRGGSKVT